MNAAWVMLVLAGLLEVVWVFALKASHGFTRLAPSVVTIVTMVASFYLLGRAMRHLPMGTAYAMWVGIGAAGAVLVGITVYGESASMMRLASVFLVVLGLAGLRLAG